MQIKKAKYYDLVLHKKELEELVDSLRFFFILQFRHYHENLDSNVDVVEFIADNKKLYDIFDAMARMLNPDKIQNLLDNLNRIYNKMQEENKDD